MYILKALVVALFLAILTVLTGIGFGETLTQSMIGGFLLGLLSFLLLWLDKDASPVYPDKT